MGYPKMCIKLTSWVNSEVGSYGIVEIGKLGIDVIVFNSYTWMKHSKIKNNKITKQYSLDVC